eukprot:TRINITY_DN10366_c1_g2_i1.p2 TRINITY_DN10366_c1_g2~~TRINITY_DN10366_c1_g2_i1.p2  ORF type:complete len:462 (+),score=186.11 TRINITY_DN10366_c1_g2_i1:72-1457(+)
MKTTRVCLGKALKAKSVGGGGKVLSFKKKPGSGSATVRKEEDMAILKSQMKLQREVEKSKRKQAAVCARLKDRDEEWTGRTGKILDAPEEVPPATDRVLRLIDTGDLIHRSFYAIPVHAVRVKRCHPNKALWGKPANAASGFARGLIKQMQKLRPGDMLAVAFDTAGGTWRNDVGEAPYKGGRKRDERLSHQFAMCYELAVALVGEEHCFKLPRMEADDTIAHYINAAQKQDVEVLTFSQDQDLYQFLTDPPKKDAERTRQVRKVPSWTRVDGRREVEAAFGLPPEYLKEYWALCGQPCDNILGVPGVGKGRAAKLINPNFPAVKGRFRKLEDLFKMDRKKLHELTRSQNITDLLLDKAVQKRVLEERLMMELPCPTALAQGEAHARAEGRKWPCFDALHEVEFKGPRQEGLRLLKQYGWSSHAEQLETTMEMWKQAEQRQQEGKVVVVVGQRAQQKAAHI